MNKILVVEDSEDSFQLVDRALGKNVVLHWAQTLKEGLRKIKENAYDLVLLDVMLPDGDGFQMCSIMQASDELQNIPVMFLTARHSTNDKVLGFSTGADDYIPKPFDLLELRARVEARLRKRAYSKKKENLLRLGDLQVNVSAQKVTVFDNKQAVELDLTPIEYKILTLLMREPNKVFSRDEILDNIWGKDVHVYSRSVDTHVSKLRKKLNSKSQYIQSVHGTGYKVAVGNVAASPRHYEYEGLLPH